MEKERTEQKPSFWVWFFGGVHRYFRGVWRDRALRFIICFCALEGLVVMNCVFLYYFAMLNGLFLWITGFIIGFFVFSYLIYREEMHGR